MEFGVRFREPKHMAVEDPRKRSYSAPLKGLGVDIRQV